MAKFFFLGVALLLGATGCQKDASSPMPPPAEPELPALASGSVAALTLAYGEEKRVSVDGGSARVSFVQVQEGRCAKEVCYRCSGGYATVTVRVQLNGQAAQDLAFQCESCQSKSPQTLDKPIAFPQTTQGYTVSVIDLTELSMANLVPKEKYVVRLFLAK